MGCTFIWRARAAVIVAINARIGMDPATPPRSADMIKIRMGMSLGILRME